MRPLVGTMICSDAQIASFEAFSYTVLANGSLPFNFPDPRMGATEIGAAFLRTAWWR